MEYQNAVSEGHLETAHCTYNTKSLSLRSGQWSLWYQSLSPAAFSTTQDPTPIVRCGSPTLLPSYGATRPLARQRSLPPQSPGAYHECIFSVPHEGEAGTGVDLGVGIVLLDEQPGAVVWGADPVGATMGSLTKSSSQNPPTCPHESSAVHGC